MLNAGSVVCLHCGRVIKKLYYYCNQYKAWVVLNRSTTGKYFVEKYTPDGNEGNSSKVTEVKLTPKMDNFRKGLCDTIHVNLVFDGSSLHNVAFTRCCPFCASVTGDENVNEIFEGMGALPTYVIAVIGTRTVGKSCWLGSLSYVGNQNAIIYDYILESLFVEGSKSGKMQATLVNSRGKTSLLTISKKVKDTGRKEPVANVLVLDVAGELFLSGNEDTFRRSQAYTLFAGTEDFTGVDAVVFMDAADCVEKDLTTAYDRVRRLGLLEEKPVAYVLNKMDLLFKKPPTVKLDEEDIAVPILTSNTFRKFDRQYYGKYIVPRVKLETLIAAQYREVAQNIFLNNPCAAGFVIKTGEPIKDDSEKKSALISFDYANSKSNDDSKKLSVQDLDYAKSINVMDPLIWVLNELDILPIK